MTIRKLKKTEYKKFCSDLSEMLFEISPITEKAFKQKETLIIASFNTKKQITGFSSWSYHEKYKEFCIFTQLYVLPEYRRQGLSKLLIEFRLSKLKGMFAVRVNPTARRMFRKYGFNKKCIYSKYIAVKDDKGKNIGFNIIPASEFMKKREKEIFE